MMTGRRAALGVGESIDLCRSGEPATRKRAQASPVHRVCVEVDESEGSLSSRRREVLRGGDFAG